MILEGTFAMYGGVLWSDEVLDSLLQTSVRINDTQYTFYKEGDHLMAGFLVKSKPYGDSLLGKYLDFKVYADLNQETGFIVGNVEFEGVSLVDRCAEEDAIALREVL